MNIRVFAFHFALFLFCQTFLGAQEISQHMNACGSKVVFKEKMELLEADLLSQNQNNFTSQSLAITIPVVVHIIHQNGNENISDDEVTQGIEHLNNAFANAGYYNQNTGVATGIQFCLAKQDPQGNSTTGVNRIVSPLTEMIAEQQDMQLKDLSRWDPEHYLNIWLVKDVCSIAYGCESTGYAFFPDAHGTPIDGIVIEYYFFGSTPGITSTLVHQIGHYLGLYHSFSGGCYNNDCTTDGDKVCDTPPNQTTVEVPCDATINTCGTDTDSGFATDQSDMIWNYMTYGDFNCFSGFTIGQLNRMEFFIDGVRSSLYDSKGCDDPCMTNIVANFTASNLNFPIGTTVNFTNTSTGTTSYEWQVDGMTFSTSENTTYTFNNEGTYELKLIVGNDDPNCFDVTSITVTCYCPLISDPNISATSVLPGTSVSFSSTTQNISSFQWLINGSLISSLENFDYTFNQLGTYNVQLIIGNNICSDTSAYSVVTVTENLFPQTGLPVWPIVAFRSPIIQDVDWQNPVPSTSVVTTNGATEDGVGGVAFNGCGDALFYVIHTGSNEPNELVIMKSDGTSLLDNQVNAPGLFAVRGSQEIQVVKVPTFDNEWFIIYSEWSHDNTAWNDYAGYNVAKQRYSRVRYEDDVITVLERDVLLTSSGGTERTYTDGKAVSRTINGNTDGHYLYLTRRVVNDPLISIDRFIINADGINYDANTGSVDVGYWSLTPLGSHIELSPTEEKIAVVNRNESINHKDVIVFDANSFNNTNVVFINQGQLTLVPDGTANDASNVLPYAGTIQEIANTPSLPLNFLVNFEKKLAKIEFSPNGRFLYMVGGGFVGGSVTHLTYLAQIDLESNPLEVRLQVQSTPFGDYSATSGAGCNVVIEGCIPNYHGLGHLESCYDGNLYFTKSSDNKLYVLPDPNNIMPQNLIPSDIDFSDAEHPNIVLPDTFTLLPDQIDGFNYLNSSAGEIELIVNNLNCLDECVAPYTLNLMTGGAFTNSYEITSCPDTIRFCANFNDTYTIEEPISEISYTNINSGTFINYPTGAIYFDFSSNPDCIEICGNGLDDDFDGDIDCEDEDITDECCCQNPPTLDLAEEIFICENGIAVLSPNNNNFVSYQWQDGSTESSFTATSAGTFWLTAIDTCGQIASDTVSVVLETGLSLDLGPDLSTCPNVGVQLSISGFETAQWFPSATLDCSECLVVNATPLEPTTYIVVATNAQGCVTTDTIFVDVRDEIEVVDDMMICEGDTVSLFGQPAFETGFYENLIPNSIGCDTLKMVNLQVMTAPSAIFTTTDVNCYGESNGSISLAPDGSDFQYSLDGIDFQEELFFDNLQAGTYQLSVSNAAECLKSYDFTIIEPEEIILTLPPDTTFRCDEIIQIESSNSDGTFSFSWNPDETLSCEDCPNPIATPDETTTYELTIIDSNGCSTTEKITLTFDLYRPLYIPNVFSPNGDGINDLFYFSSDGEEYVYVHRLLIFSRWGELLFEKSDFFPNNSDYAWDGSFLEEIQGVGVYVYFAEVEYCDGKLEMVTGDVTIVK